MMSLSLSLSFAQESPEKRIERRIDFIKAYIQNQDRILKLSENIPEDYKGAGAAFSTFAKGSFSDPQSAVINDLETAMLFYTAAASSFSLATEFYKQVESCIKVNDHYRLFLPLKNFKGDPEHTCEFSDNEKAKFPSFDLTSVCISRNFQCEPYLFKFGDRRDAASARSQVIANRSAEDYYYNDLYAFSADWIVTSLSDFYANCHPQYPKCKDEKCQYVKWAIKVTEDHDRACLKLKDIANKQNILLSEKETKKNYNVEQPFFPLVFNSVRYENGSFSLNDRLLALNVKQKNYYLYSPLLRGGAWYALAETLFEKNKKVIEEMEKMSVKNSVLQKFRLARLKAQDKRLSTQEGLDRARFKFNIDDYVRNF